ncbi:DUF1844 domain-containing protein [Bryobacter aggregatus]|uniref:DUF1844 domain-containing protein n=1 Tax=Bryobacter aggregatus TaxID=360054 RepID=UPI0004E17FC2|nr:DUF1844 domain-containing protein [Bryobacter aggregatus]
MSDLEAKPPQASFEFLIASFIMQAQMQLGMFQMPEGEGEENKPNLAWAKHAIDLLGVLEEKTKGNLTLEEKRMLENSLTELRFRYVQAISGDTK